jgi:hypothetical protein
MLPQQEWVIVKKFLIKKMIGKIFYKICAIIKKIYALVEK